MDDARMLGEGGGGEKNERGSESELSHASLDRGRRKRLGGSEETPCSFSSASADARLCGHEDDHSAYDANDRRFQPAPSMMVRCNNDNPTGPSNRPF